MTTQSLMTVKEVAQYLKVSPLTIYRLVYEQKIPALKVGRQWRFRKDEVYNYLIKVTWHPPR